MGVAGSSGLHVRSMAFSAPTPLRAAMQTCRRFSGTAAALFKLPALPYDYAALEPHFDEQTMRIHHSKHHATYVAGINGAAGALDAAAKKGDGQALAGLQRSAVAAGTAVRNHGGGHYNHSFFWVNLQPSDAQGEPSKDLMAAIQEQFGGFDGLKEAFNKQATTRFGSGWAWLGVTPEGKLAVTSTANQDNPLMEGLEYPVEKMIPILGLDVWEHAYYLRYQNRRPDYINAFWNVVNWGQVNRNYEVYAKKGQPVPAAEE